MKIILCAFGRAGIESIYYLLGNVGILISDLLVFTHNRNDNEDLINHLINLEIKFETKNINSSIDELNNFKGNILISMYYRNIISKEVIELVKGKAFNVHPSLLPKYRGAFSSVWAIINNEKHTGVTFHYMNEKIDDGKIIIQKKIRIEEEDTAFSLYHKLISISIFFLGEAIKLVMDGFEGELQVGEKSYYGRSLPYDGKMELNQGNVDLAIRFIRAMNFSTHCPAKIIYNGTIHEIQYVRELRHILNTSYEQ
jgi:UDP-4-amino-4-deoxy-L-arabinose formyltransferase/UDP-glucuronic acid dehydrogenase (UDP-4-keto-hexauronic acid decarboxylating)